MMLDRVEQISLLFIFLSLTLVDFQIGSVYFFVFGILVYVLASFIKYKKEGMFSGSCLMNSIFILLLFSSGVCIFSAFPFSFKKYCIQMNLILLPMYFFYTYLYQYLKKSQSFVKQIVKWLKIGILVHLALIPIQYILYHFFSFDLNMFIFNDLLHIFEAPTFFRQGTYYPSGLTWHSALLAPVFVLSFLLFKNDYIRFLVIADSLICGNLTSQVGVVLCMILLIVCAMKEGNVRNLITGHYRFIVLSLFAVCVGLCIPSIRNTILIKLQYIISRVSIHSGDSSSSAHLSYYTLYPQIVKNSNIFQILFGCGYGTSGYPITMINGQYATVAHWVVESDIIDILVSRGIIGFIVYYCFLISIGIEGFKINKKYLILIIVILVQGFAYNIQFEYVFALELFLFAAVQLKIDIFQDMEEIS